VAVWVISATAAGFYQLVIAWKGTGAAITVSGALLKRMAGYSFQSHIANVTTFLRLRLDMFLIAAYLNSQEVGYYGIAVSLIGLLWFMPTAIAQVLVPYISLRDHAVANDVTPRLCRVSVLVAVIGGIILAVLGKPILRLLYGAAYLPSYPALVVLVPGSVFYGIGKMLAGDLLGRGMPRYAMIISIVSLAANIGINIGLIPYWGIVGAALASSLTQILVGVLFMYYFVKASGTPVSDLFIFRRGDLRKLWHADRPR